MFRKSSVPVLFINRVDLKLGKFACFPRSCGSQKRMSKKIYFRLSGQFFFLKGSDLGQTNMGKMSIIFSVILAHSIWRRISENPDVMMSHEQYILTHHYGDWIKHVLRNLKACKEFFFNHILNEIYLFLMIDQFCLIRMHGFNILKTRRYPC